MRRGFSAIELAVVLVLIAIFVVLLLPVFEKGRTKAYEMKCLQRVRQVGITMELYRGDHNGAWPHARRSVHPDYPEWADPTASLGLLYPNYVTKTYLFECPATDDEARIDTYAHDIEGARNFYVSPDGVDTRDGSKGHTPPSCLSYFYDGGWPVETCIPKRCPTNRVIYGDECPHGVWRARDDETLWLGEGNHEGGGNFLFVDLHAEWLDTAWSGEPWDRGRSRPSVPNPHEASSGDVVTVVKRDLDVFQSQRSDQMRYMDADLAGMMWVEDGWKEF